MNQAEARYARLAARLLAEQGPGTVAAAADPPPDTRRDAMVATMALAIAEQTRRRHILRASAVGLAVAASIALAVGLSRPGTGPVGSPRAAFYVEHEIGRDNLLVRDGLRQPLPDLAAIAAGDTLRVGVLGGVTLAAGNGTRITLGGASHLRADELADTRRFSLLAGHVDAQVAKLAPAERFIVDTPNAEVEVRGTRFTVVVEDSPPACTGSGAVSTVKVSEGAVAVRYADGQILLHPGDAWTAPCPQGRAPEAKPSQPPPGPTAAQAPGSPARPRRSLTANSAMPTVGRRDPGAEAADLRPVPGLGQAPPASNLAEQNDMFQAALAAERLGQTETALAKLVELLSRYPHGPLAESAQAERARILSAQGRAQ